MKRIFLSAIALLIILLGVGFLYLNGARFTTVACLREMIQSQDAAIEILAEEDTYYGKVVLFKEDSRGIFGTAGLYRVLGFLWSPGPSSTKEIDESLPFNTTGNYNGNKKQKDQMITGIYINDRDIKNMAIGNGPEIATKLEQTYEFSLEQAKTKSDIYKVVDVSQGYAFIVTDKDNNGRWTFTAFDNNGKLSADQIFGSEPRYVDFSESGIMKEYAGRFYRAINSGQGSAIKFLTDDEGLTLIRSYPSGNSTRGTEISAELTPDAIMPDLTLKPADNEPTIMLQVEFSNQNDISDMNIYETGMEFNMYHTAAPYLMSIFTKAINDYKIPNSGTHILKFSNGVFAVANFAGSDLRYSRWAVFQSKEDKSYLKYLIMIN